MLTGDPIVYIYIYIFNWTSGHFTDWRSSEASEWHTLVSVGITSLTSLNFTVRAGLVNAQFDFGVKGPMIDCLESGRASRQKGMHWLEWVRSKMGESAKAKPKPVTRWTLGWDFRDLRLCSSGQHGQLDLPVGERRILCTPSLHERLCFIIIYLFIYPSVR